VNGHLRSADSEVCVKACDLDAHCADARLTANCCCNTLTQQMLATLSRNFHICMGLFYLLLVFLRQILDNEKFKKLFVNIRSEADELGTIP
jgi:hypothetical protein